MGELMNQYAGIPYDDPRMQPYYEIAEKHGIPVAFHVHAGPPGIREACCPDFRLSLGDPILLEEVLVKYPDMKVQIMHANALIYPVIMDMLVSVPPGLRGHQPVSSHLDAGRVPPAAETLPGQTDVETGHVRQRHDGTVANHRCI